MNNLSSIETAVLWVLNDLKNNVDLDNIINLQSTETNLFNHFVVKNIAGRSLLSEGEENRSKFEARFFWPFTLSPEIYDLSNLIFDPKYYEHKTTHDTYIISNNGLNVKIRKNELHFKALFKKLVIFINIIKRKK